MCKHSVVRLALTVIAATALFGSLSGAYYLGFLHGLEQALAKL